MPLLEVGNVGGCGDKLDGHTAQCNGGRKSTVDWLSLHAWLTTYWTHEVMAPKTYEADLVLTIDDDVDVSDEESLSASEDEESRPATKRKRVEDETELDEDFVFDIGGNDALQDFDSWDTTAHDRDTGHERKGVDIADIVARRQAKRAKLDTPASNDLVPSEDEDDIESFGGLEEQDDEDILAEDGFGGQAVDEDSNEGDENDASEDGQEESDEQDEAEAAPVAHPDDEVDSDAEASEKDEEELRKENAFFAQDQVDTDTDGASFFSLSLSRPILKGLTAVGFTAPTPIQAKTVPVALMGKDVVGGAVTGSGKTAAFMIPILERLLFRQKKTATTRVAILMPTRELALQCFAVGKKLAAFTDITFGQAIGGMNSREQEKDLKKRPDIVVATPGRFIDFMRNSSSFAVDTIEILVLDEADRMLEEGFADELNEILSTIPKSRQTMLFSATMTSKVDDLIRIGMQRPVRIMVDALKSSAAGLTQEFVRLRPGRENKRLGYLMYLCTTTYTNRVIIFFRQKKEAHRVCIVFALAGLQAAELHGSMTQDQRIRAIEAFRSGSASFLLATDVASRGLDIKGIEAVINYEAPQSHEIYLHRVGRTARAGRSGRACTIAAEPDRKVVKAAVKAARNQGAKVQQRSVDPKDADEWQQRVDAMEDEIEDVMKEEKEERALQATERDLNRAGNFVKHEAEIMARPKKTWFQSEKDKDAAKLKGRVELNGPEVAKPEKKLGKLSNKQKKQLTNRDERKAGLEWKKGKNAAMAMARGKPSRPANGKPSRPANGKPSRPANGTKGKPKRR